jgi:hypothetical protein
MATLTLIIDYLFTMKNVEYPVASIDRTKNSVYNANKIHVLYDVIIDDLKSLEKDKTIIDETRLNELITTLFGTGKLSQNARNEREKITNITDSLERYYNNDDYDEIPENIKPILEQITYVINHPEEAKKDIKTIWSDAYKRIKDIPIEEANANILVQRESRYNNTRAKITNIRNRATENIPVNYKSIKNAEKDYYLNISALYAIHNDLKMETERWNNDNTIDRIREIFDRYDITSSTSGGRRSKNRKSQRKIRKSKKTRKN